jgi:DNA-binding NarL/FixJ family response regulator
MSDLPAVRIVTADGHSHLRAHLRAALEAGGFTVCAEAASAYDAVRLAGQHRPELALIDVHLPGNGIRAASEIHRLFPAVEIVMLAAAHDDRDLFESLRAGASGYLLKDTDPRRLPAALRGVLAGEAAISRTMVARILDEFRLPGGSRQARRSTAAGKLSSREWEVMELLAHGHGTDEVARRLHLSPTTVRVHVSSVLRKLRVKDRKGAIDMLRDGPR